MPAKKLITRQKIIDTAFQIVQRDGMDSLNMRNLAKMCNCSTQPIYLSFKNAEELKSALERKIAEEFENFINIQISAGEFPEYKAIGMGYIKFAAEQPELFKYLFMRKRGNEGYGNESFDKATFSIMKNYGLYKNDAAKLHVEMWVFIHGIATMFVTGYLNWDWQTVSEMVSDVFKGLTAKNGGSK